MTFTFETTIKETKGALNTAAKIVEILKTAEVTFSTLKDNDVPCIFVKFQGDEKKRFVANLDGDSPDDEQVCEKYEGTNVWWTAYAKRPHGRYGQESFLFNHLTDAAEELVNTWIVSLCDEYDRRITADAV